MSPKALYHSLQSQAVSQVSLYLSLWVEAQRHPSEEPGWPTFASTSVASPTKPVTPHDSGHSAPQRRAATLTPPVSIECSLTFVNLPGRASLLKGLGLPNSHNCAQLDLQGISSKKQVADFISPASPEPLGWKVFPFPVEVQGTDFWGKVAHPLAMWAGGAYPDGPSGHWRPWW